MFAVLVAGRLVQTDVHQIEEMKVLFDLEDITDANHIVVFMTGQTPFPDGFGGAVYLNLPSASGESNWLLLGHLTNQKPSSIYKITGIKKDFEQSTPNVFGSMTALPSPAQPHHAQLGIAVEPLTMLVQQTPVSGISAPKATTLMEFTQKMLQTFYNYASSFACSRETISNSLVGSPSDQFVPLNTLDKWFIEFQSKLQRDPNFWKS
uniref:protein Hikeshi-like n=1 Tax=Styela clava TaxID=7725 RepID=UPI001939DAC7|nr:protein Hikeshi-like [Styela clava]